VVKPVPLHLKKSTWDTLEIADALDCRGADLVSPAAGRMIFRLLAVLAEFERDVISERTSMAMRQMQATGRYIGGQGPFGFTLLVNGDLEPIPEEQVVIARVQFLHAAGVSLRKIAATLHQEGHRTRLDRYFRPEQIRRMVRLAWPRAPRPAPA
jgi:DNA invertase Pin-like site-specific DNA recombinase